MEKPVISVESFLVGLDPNGSVDYIDGSPILFLIWSFALYSNFHLVFYSFVIYVFVIK